MAVGPDQAMRSNGNDTTAAGLKKGPWTPSEDAILLEYVRKHGEGNWNAVQKNSGLSRCGKSCRLRWANHLRPNLKKGAFSPEEELLILRLHAQLGNKWARMAAHLPGRTDNEIKNYWNTRIKRRQRAGLPLYPTDIQRQASAAPPPPLSAGLDPFGFPSRPRYHLPLKRLRDDTALNFHLGFSSPPPLYQPPVQPFQYSPMGFSAHGSSAFGVKMGLELPSSQMYGEGGGLLDAMLRETEDGGEEGMKWVQMVNGEGDGDGGATPPEAADKDNDDDSEPPSGKKMKTDEQEANHELSALLDMIPKTVMPASAAIQISDQWCSADSGGISNEQSSVITDEEMGHWNIGACPWNPAGIC